MPSIEAQDRIWVRPREACRIGGFGLTTLYKLISEKKIETRQLGRARLVSVRSIENLGREDAA